LAIVPIMIDDIELEPWHRDVLRDMATQFALEAGHCADVAMKLACNVFTRRLFELRDGGWRAREVVKLNDAGATIHRGKCWRREQLERSAGRDGSRDGHDGQDQNEEDY
jgi:hypothetical protein